MQHSKLHFMSYLTSTRPALLVIWFSQTIKMHVAEDHSRFSFDEAPVFDDGFPKAGNDFVTHGYIYKKGFF